MSHWESLATDRSQLYAYRDRVSAILARDSKLTPADMPRIATVDASQGEESFMVLFDGSFQHGDVVGKSSFNVAGLCTY